MKKDKLGKTAAPPGNLSKCKKTNLNFKRNGRFKQSAIISDEMEKFACVLFLPAKRGYLYLPVCETAHAQSTGLREHYLCLSFTMQNKKTAIRRFFVLAEMERFELSTMRKQEKTEARKALIILHF